MHRSHERRRYIVKRYIEQSLNGLCYFATPMWKHDQSITHRYVLHHRLLPPFKIDRNRIIKYLTLRPIKVLGYAVVLGPLGKQFVSITLLQLEIWLKKVSLRGMAPCLGGNWQSTAAIAYSKVEIIGNLKIILIFSNVVSFIHPLFSITYQ